MADHDASPQLLRILLRQNQEALRGLRNMPPADRNSPLGREQLMLVDELQDQTMRLSERLDWLSRNPPPPRRRRSWRDLKPLA